MTRQAEARSSRIVPPTRTTERGRRLLRIVLYVAAATLLAESLFGSRGLPALLEARREHTALAASLDRLKTHNAQLRARARLLRSDPLTVESLARRELTMIAPGEKVFIVRDAQPARK